MKISEHITIGEVIRNYPDAKKVLKSFGLTDLNETEDQLDKLGEVCVQNGVQTEEVIKALRENVEAEIRW